MLMLCFKIKSQIIYYPKHSSILLKSTAHDAADIFGNSISGSNFFTHEYTTLPPSGIVFMYDSTISDNQLCLV